MGVIKETVQVLVDIGLLDVILPFIIVFSITWSMLERSQVLGENGSRYNTIVAFVLGFFVVAALQIVTVINTIMQWSAVFVILICFALVFAKLFGGDLSGSNYPKVISLAIVGVVALYALGVSDWLSIDFLERYILPLVILMLAVGGVAYLIMKPATSAAAPSSPPSTTKSKSKSGKSTSRGSDEPEQGPSPPLFPDHPSHRYVGRVKPKEQTRDL